MKQGPLDLSRDRCFEDDPPRLRYLRTADPGSDRKRASTAHAESTDTSLGHRCNTGPAIFSVPCRIVAPNAVGPFYGIGHGLLDIGLGSLRRDGWIDVCGIVLC